MDKMCNFLQVFMSEEKKKFAYLSRIFCIFCCFNFSIDAEIVWVIKWLTAIEVILFKKKDKKRKEKENKNQIFHSKITKKQ